jgi:hypothetical protein
MLNKRIELLLRNPNLQGPFCDVLELQTLNLHGGGGSSGTLVRLLSTPSVPVAADTVARMLREVQSFVDPLPSPKNIKSVAQERDRNRKCIQEFDAISVLA